MTGFINGGFENGNSQGWILGGGERSAVPTEALDAQTYLPGGIGYDASVASTHSSIATSGFDPIVGNLMANIVHSGSYSWRVEDLDVNSYLSVISQQISSYYCQDIYFAWLAVLENGFHQANESSAMIIELRDTTTNETVLSRLYNAGLDSNGVDTRFQTLSSIFYTPSWQIEHFTVDSSRIGHDFALTILVADCALGAHLGYAYLDDFGGIDPSKK